MAQSPNSTEQLTHANSYPGNSSSTPEPPSSSSLTLFAPNATIASDLSPFNYHSHPNVHGALIGGKKKTIPAGIYPYVECKIGKLYDQRHVKSHTHVVFDVVDIAFCEPSCLSFCFFLGQMSWQMGLKFRL